MYADQEGVGEAAISDQASSLISASLQFSDAFTCLHLSFDPFKEVGGTSRLPIIAAFNFFELSCPQILRTWGNTVRRTQIVYLV